MGFIVEEGRTSGDDIESSSFSWWMYRQIRVPRRTRQICHIRGEQSEPAACISRYAAPTKGQARGRGVGYRQFESTDDVSRRAHQDATRRLFDGCCVIRIQTQDVRSLTTSFPLSSSPSLFFTLEENTSQKLRNYAAILQKV